MTHDRIAAEWAIRGPIARMARFRIVEQDGRLDFIADLVGAGGLLRAFRSIPGDSPDEDIQDALSAVYVELGGVERVAERIRTQSFNDRLNET